MKKTKWLSPCQDFHSAYDEQQGVEPSDLCTQCGYTKRKHKSPDPKKWMCSSCLDEHTGEPAKLIIPEKKLLSPRLGTQTSITHYLCMTCAKGIESQLGSRNLNS